MKPFSILFIIVFIALFSALNVNVFGQSSQIDYQVVENNYPGRIEFEKSVKGSQNFYFNKSEIPVLLQLDSILMGKYINNLHLYVSAKPGEIDFGRFILSADNVAGYSSQLKNLNQIVMGRVVIHNSLVFNEVRGKQLKQKLQEISGLPFETR
jgi:hypothetical protein